MERRPYYSRRDFVLAASIGAGALAVSRADGVLAQAAPIRETADLIVGPFYPQQKPTDTDFDMTHVRGRSGQAAGQVVRIEGRLLNRRGDPLVGRRMEIWQANSRGRYNHPSDPNVELPLDPDFQGYAAMLTDREGRYVVTTVKPGPYPTPRGDLRAPHVHFEIHGDTDRKTTQMFFPGEPLNQEDRHLNSVRRTETVLASIASPISSVLIARWEIVLANG